MKFRDIRRWTRQQNIIPAGLILALLAGCSGGQGSTPAAAVAAAECDPTEAATFAECGSVMVALTDADGDFLNYTVNVVSLQLETANGRSVETLPQQTRINFSDYVDLTELVSVVTVPPATYVAGTITLDYSDAEIFVEASGNAKEAVVTDLEANPLLTTELRISLSNREQLKVVKGRASLLQLDFDLDASHSVDIAPTPAVAAAEPFIVAEIAPVDEKDLRVRGPLVDVDIAASAYTVALRPFHDRDGDFGDVDVFVDDATLFEIDAVEYTGLAGLDALAAAGPRTATVALGVLDVNARQFSAHTVLGGSSVPGSGLDAVTGHVIAREGNVLTVRGATVIVSDRRAHFHDNVIVEIGPETRVSKQGSFGMALDIDAISIGQKVSIRGSVGADDTDAATSAIHVDATRGAVRLEVTRLMGVVNNVVPGQTDLTLHGIDRRRVDIFDFSGTGSSPADDADPANYEVATGDLALAALAAGKPLVAYGYPTAFGSAPHDFDGRTVINFGQVRSVLGIGWRPEGTTAPFLRLDADGLVLDHLNEAIDRRHHIKTGPVVVDLTELDAATTIVPKDTGRSLYYIKSGDSLRQYSEFSDFAADLGLSLDGANAVRILHARGHYDAAMNVLTADKIGVDMLEAQ